MEKESMHNKKPISVDKKHRPANSETARRFNLTSIMMVRGDIEKGEHGIIMDPLPNEMSGGKEVIDAIPNQSLVVIQAIDGERVVKNPIDELAINREKDRAQLKPATTELAQPTRGNATKTTKRKPGVHTVRGDSEGLGKIDVGRE